MGDRKVSGVCLEDDDADADNDEEDILEKVPDDGDDIFEKVSDDAKDIHEKVSDDSDDIFEPLLSKPQPQHNLTSTLGWVD